MIASTCDQCHLFGIPCDACVVVATILVAADAAVAVAAAAVYL